MSDAPYRPLYRKVPTRPEPPPRRLPLRVRAKLRLAGRIGATGWGLLFLGSILGWAVAANIDLRDWNTHERNTRLVKGIVLAYDESTGYTKWEFTDVDGTTRRGASYAKHRKSARTPGTKLTIVVPEDDPDAGRMLKGRYGIVPVGFLVVLVLPVAGVVCLWLAWRRGHAGIRLLKTGVVAEGRVVAFDGAPTIRIRYVVSEQDYELVVERSPAVGDDDLEPILYDPQYPEYATPLDGLPGTPRIADDGAISTHWGQAEATALVLPFATVIANLIAAAIVFVA